MRIITQITRSLVGLSRIERVWLRNDGTPWGLSRMDGGISNRPYKPGTEALPGDCFAALP